MGKCDCYFQHGLKSVCYGTKEMEACSCGGDERKCNFYPEKRKPMMATEKRLIDVCAEIRKIEDVLAERKEQADSFTYRVFEAVKTALEKAPTVDAVEVVHGRWEILDGYVMCSVCGQIMYEDYNYCPNCGAKMDGDGNG